MRLETTIFETIVGSHAYGTAHALSDQDVKGIFIEPPHALLTLRDLPEQISDERGDVVYYSLRRFLSLALSANPNIIELLFMPDDCIRLCHPAFRLLLDSRSLFITKQAYASHARYAQSQIRKARGQNKWVNNSQPERPPEPKEFCWFVPQDHSDSLPFRSISLSDADIQLEECHASSLEHAPHIYRLYHYGSHAKGVFRGESIVCESIPLDDEVARCVGLLIFNESAYKRARLDHANYWTWRKNRNEQRWQTQESGLLDYDAKNLMHMFRLMLSAEHILTVKEPLVRFSGEPLQFLKNVLNGYYAYDELIARADEMSEKLEALHRQSDLPEEPDFSKAEELLKTVTQSWIAAHECDYQ